MHNIFLAAIFTPICDAFPSEQNNQSWVEPQSRYKLYWVPLDTLTPITHRWINWIGKRCAKLHQKTAKHLRWHCCLSCIRPTLRVANNSLNSKYYWAPVYYSWSETRLKPMRDTCVEGIQHQMCILLEGLKKPLSTFELFIKWHALTNTRVLEKHFIYYPFVNIPFVMPVLYYNRILISVRSEPFFTHYTQIRSNHTFID
jgi:hypothetical protein